MKQIILVLAAMIMTIIMAACGHSVSSNKTDAEQPREEIKMEQRGYTEAVPSDYLKDASEQGTLTTIEYDSVDYAGSGSAVRKNAVVYLPYGYDAEDTDMRYNIMYLMHGWTGYAGDYFDYSNTKNILDNMIENGDTDPLIVVAGSFYHENSSTDFGSSVAALRAFHQDFEENLMPAIEGQFNTYAKSVSDEDLRASRDHRAFGGFSLGSVTTWQIFVHDYDYVRYFLPMSGSSWYYGGYGDFQTEKNVDYIERLVDDNNLDERGYFIYHAVGTRDSVRSQTIDQADEMLARSEVFTPDHYMFYQKDGGQHDFYAAQEFIYNALPLFFRDSGSGEEAETMSTDPYDKNTKIAEVRDDPAFGDHGRLIFPVDSGYKR